MAYFAFLLHFKQKMAILHAYFAIFLPMSVVVFIHFEIVYIQLFILSFFRNDIPVLSIKGLSALLFERIVIQQVEAIFQFFS